MLSLGIFICLSMISIYLPISVAIPWRWLMTRGNGICVCVYVHTHRFNGIYIYIPLYIYTIVCVCIYIYHYIYRYIYNEIPKQKSLALIRKVRDRKKLTFGEYQSLLVYDLYVLSCLDFILNLWVKWIYLWEDKGQNVFLLRGM